MVNTSTITASSDSDYAPMTTDGSSSTAPLSSESEEAAHTQVTAHNLIAPKSSESEQAAHAKVPAHKQTAPMSNQSEHATRAEWTSNNLTAPMGHHRLAHGGSAQGRYSSRSCDASVGLHAGVDSLCRCSPFLECAWCRRK